jgi:hypothetical protein
VIGRRSGGCRRDLDHRRTLDPFGSLPERIPPRATAAAEEAVALGRWLASEVVTVDGPWVRITTLLEEASETRHAMDQIIGGGTTGDGDIIPPAHEAPWPDCQLGVPAARRLPLRSGQVILARDAEIAGKL